MPYTEVSAITRKRKKLEEIASMLRLAEVTQGEGIKRADAAHQLGLNQQTFYTPGKLYAGMDRPQQRSLKDLEKANHRLRQAASDLTLDKVMLNEAAERNY